MKISAMNSDKIERRKFTRFTVPQDEAFVFCHEINKTASVVDISMGGLKFGYYAGVENKFKSMLVDIYEVSQGRFFIFDLPCKVIYDVADLEENSTFSGSNKRLSGLKYEKLSAEQNAKLTYLVNFAIR
jgi:c-di-GMP-binding flagellar brake protein YcgR